MLEPLGLALLVLGFSAGALVAILDPDAVAWGSYAVCLAAGIAGVTLIRIGSHRRTSDQATLTAQMEDLRSSIERLAEQAALLESPDDDRIYDLPEEIDARFPSLIARFTSSREAIARVYGIRTYAEIMGELAAGERYLNRVWSAAAEGYVDEATEYLARARRQLERTRDHVRALPRSESPSI